MPFIGTTPAQGFASIFNKQTFTANGSTTSFTLSNRVNNANDLEVFVGNVRQEPTEAYSASGLSLVMTEAPANGVSFYVIYKGYPDDFGIPMYVGESMTSVGTRISRFVKEVMNNSRSDENHSAARKWRGYFGSDLSECYVRVFEESAQFGGSHLEIEAELKRRLNPLLNVR